MLLQSTNSSVMRRFLRLGLGALGVAAIAVGAWAYFHYRPITVEVASVERDVPVEVYGLGTVEARIVSQIGFEAPIRVSCGSAQRNSSTPDRDTHCTAKQRPGDRTAKPAGAARPRGPAPPARRRQSGLSSGAGPAHAARWPRRPGQRQTRRDPAIGYVATLALRTGRRS